MHPNSANIIASIGGDKPLRYNTDMGSSSCRPDQKRVEVKIVGYPANRTRGRFPCPTTCRSRVGRSTTSETGKHLNRRWTTCSATSSTAAATGTAIVVDPVNRMLYEFFAARKTDDGWQAAQASVFDLKTNDLRPDGWTSADAAGLPIFPAVVRYDELQRGRIEHAMRVTVRKTRRAFVAPATHFASRHENEDYPRMGERIRLKADFDVSGSRPRSRRS